MPSTHFSRLLVDHLDGDLDANGREALAREIENDPAAAKLFDDALHIEALLTAAHQDGAAAAVGSQRRHSTARPAGRPHGRRPLRIRASHWQPWAAAAALLLTLGGGFWYVTSGRSAPATALIQGLVMINGQPAQTIADGVPFTVAGDDEAKIKLADGSQVSFDPASEAIIRGRNDAARQTIDLTTGTGEFRVEKGFGPFKVVTSIGEVTVLGTHFTVTLRPAEGAKPAVMMVAVASGSVQVEHNGKLHLLTATEQPIFSSDEEHPLAKAGDEKAKPAADAKASHPPLAVGDEHGKEAVKEPKEKGKFAEFPPLRAGHIKTIDSDAGTVTVALGDHNGETAVILVGPATKIRLNGLEAKLGDLRIDDRVDFRPARESGAPVLFLSARRLRPGAEGEIHKPRIHGTDPRPKAPGDGKPEGDQPAK